MKLRGAALKALEPLEGQRLCKFGHFIAHGHGHSSAKLKFPDLECLSSARWQCGIPIFLALIAHEYEREVASHFHDFCLFGVGGLLAKSGDGGAARDGGSGMNQRHLSFLNGKTLCAQIGWAIDIGVPAGDG